MIATGLTDTSESSKTALRKMPVSGKRFAEEFEIEAVIQVVDRGHFVSSAATRIDTIHSL